MAKNKSQMQPPYYKITSFEPIGFEEDEGGVFIDIRFETDHAQSPHLLLTLSYDSAIEAIQQFDSFLYALCQKSSHPYPPTSH